MQVAPFTSDVLSVNSSAQNGVVVDAQTSQDAAAQPAREVDDLDLPASYSINKVHFVVPRLDSQFLAQEFNLDRLHCIMDWLWLCGQTDPPRPLNHQVQMDRRIVVTERMDLHVVRSDDRIFLKPLPRWLLTRTFWETCYDDEIMDEHKTSLAEALPRGSLRTLRSTALGFLLSYIALIQHESDFYIAKAAHVVPDELTWQQWKLLVRQVIQSSDDAEAPLRAQVADRFIYGELRLERLNIVYLVRGLSVKGYIPRWNSYGGFIRRNLDAIVAGTVYLALVLGAMQVGLSTTELGGNAAFQSVSYGTAVLAILGPLVAVVLVLGLSAMDFVRNWAWNRDNEKRTQKVLGRRWR
ncbi:hypothetical protein BD289DRAFT_434135 [Coniella lustricola]|uniref:Uncharacterized protein n=1 Tax=Coniella lustricola TaxID=2025994 RepID=A0A2T3A7U0_9PEZI|nr:hypothetical protein BD289DRAFT_434135 [Coniella lustricola]